MPATVCPQRIIKEAIRLLDKTAGLVDGETDQDIIYNIEELSALEKALARDCITNIILE